jgi:hypothetical protein
MQKDIFDSEKKRAAAEEFKRLIQNPNKVDVQPEDIQPEEQPFYCAEADDFGEPDRCKTQCPACANF